MKYNWNLLIMINYIGNLCDRKLKGVQFDNFNSFKNFCSFLQENIPGRGSFKKAFLPHDQKYSGFSGNNLDGGVSQTENYP